MVIFIVIVIVIVIVINQSTMNHSESRDLPMAAPGGDLLAVRRTAPSAHAAAPWSSTTDVEIGTDRGVRVMVASLASFFQNAKKKHRNTIGKAIETPVRNMIFL